MSDMRLVPYLQRTRRTAYAGVALAILAMVVAILGGCSGSETLSITRGVVDPSTGEIVGTVDVQYARKGLEMELDSFAYTKEHTDGTKTSVSIQGLQQSDRAADVAIAGFGTINRAVEKIAVPGFTTAGPSGIEDEAAEEDPPAEPDDGD